MIFITNVLNGVLKKIPSTILICNSAIKKWSVSLLSASLQPRLCRRLARSPLQEAIPHFVSLLSTTKHPSPQTSHNHHQLTLLTFMVAAPQFFDSLPLIFPFKISGFFFSALTKLRKIGQKWGTLTPNTTFIGFLSLLLYS